MTLVSADNLLTHDSMNPPYGIDITRFSSFIRLVRVTAWVNRFISKLKGMRNERYGVTLSCEELHDAEDLWIIFVQKKTYV